MDIKNRIFIALDGMSLNESCNFMRKLMGLPGSYTNTIAGFKIHDLWDRMRYSDLISDLKFAGEEKDIWLDLKLFDTPETVGLRAKAVKDADINYLTVHASGGQEMIKAAVEKGPKIIAVTVLTSFDESSFRNRFRRSISDMVLELAYNAKNAGAWGIVCSTHDVGILSSNSDFDGIELITPGIRLTGKDAIDENQKRVNTPKAAMESGATKIVLGRELTRAEDLVLTLSRIVDEISVAHR